MGIICWAVIHMTVLYPWSRIAPASGESRAIPHILNIPRNGVANAPCWFAGSILYIRNVTTPHRVHVCMNECVCTCVYVYVCCVAARLRRNAREHVTSHICSQINWFVNSVVCACVCGYGIEKRVFVCACNK